MSKAMHSVPFWRGAWQLYFCRMDYKKGFTDDNISMWQEPGSN